MAAVFFLSTCYSWLLPQNEDTNGARWTTKKAPRGHLPSFPCNAAKGFCLWSAISLLFNVWIIEVLALWIDWGKTVRFRINFPISKPTRICKWIVIRHTKASAVHKFSPSNAGNNGNTWHPQLHTILASTKWKEIQKDGKTGKNGKNRKNQKNRKKLGKSREKIVKTPTTRRTIFTPNNWAPLSPLQFKRNVRRFRRSEASKIPKYSPHRP